MKNMKKYYLLFSTDKPGEAHNINSHL